MSSQAVNSWFFFTNPPHLVTLRLKFRLETNIFFCSYAHDAVHCGILLDWLQYDLPILKTVMPERLSYTLPPIHVVLPYLKHCVLVYQVMYYQTLYNAGLVTMLFTCSDNLEASPAWFHSASHSCCAVMSAALCSSTEGAVSLWCNV